MANQATATPKATTTKSTTKVTPVAKATPAATPKETTPTATSKVPVGVKIIAILYYIGAALFILAAIGLFLVAGTMKELLEDTQPAAAVLFSAFGTAFAIIGAVIFIVFAVIGFFIGRGLWKAQKWARIVAIIISAIGIIFAIIMLIGGDFSSIVSLVIHVIVGGYLLFSKSVKQAFV